MMGHGEKDRPNHRKVQRLQLKNLAGHNKIKQGRCPDWTMAMAVEEIGAAQQPQCQGQAGTEWKWLDGGSHLNTESISLNIVLLICDEHDLWLLKNELI